VRVRDSVFRNSASGIFSTGNSARLTVDNSQLKDHANSGGAGISVTAGHAAIRGSTFAGNWQGIIVTNGTITVVSTMAVDSPTIGFFANTGGVMHLESAIAYNNGTALAVNGGARISNSTFVNNGTGIDINLGGTLQTRENNTVIGNGTDLVNDGTFTPIGSM
jgi:hypothetical protein